MITTHEHSDLVNCEPRLEDSSKMLIYLLSTAILLCAIHVFFNYNSVARALRKIPGPKDAFIIGNALEIIVPPDKLMDLGRDFAKRFHGLYRFWCYPLGAVTIYNPEDIEIIMSTMKHSEKSIVYNLLKQWLQEGLLLSKGEKWQTRRKILTPTFHFNILRQFSVILQENAQRLLAVLEAASERPVDVVPIISEFTLSSICETAMGTQLNEQDTNAARSYKDTIYRIGNIFSRRFARIYLFSDFIFNLTSLGREQKNLLKIVRNFTKTVIDQRKLMLENNINSDTIKDAEEYDDIFMRKKKKVAMLDLLISAEKDRLIDNAGIQEEVDTFMFEGHDTTASGLTFCMVALANNRDIQNKIVAEIKDLFGESDRAITMEDINNLPYLDRCIKESLRIYPPVHFISRKLTEDVKLSNKYDVPAGVACHISIYDLHHREDLYPDPSRFDPDRFLPEHCARRHPYAYIPFSAGPRNCIGQKFALLEMKLVLAEVLRKFELQPVTRPEDLSFIGDLVLRNKGPVYVNFTKRNSAATQ
ncbi:cytochrome P450 4C1-like [Cydia fagiglandana]|uniref:cytochrome P450 4C1-like n=1 Tax=Cydia fagiglandana TaxID=1458189 RepID=UPI002FEE39E0